MSRKARKISQNSFFFIAFLAPNWHFCNFGTKWRYLKESKYDAIAPLLEEIIPTLSSEENIKRLCFRSGGLLVGEYKRIFSDLFHKKGPLYSKIVSRLADGSCDQEEIRTSVGMEKGGRLSEYLFDLEMAGFISEDQTWHFSSKKLGRLRKYRLKDNYLRFYLTYIQPNLSMIEQDVYRRRPAAWPQIFGLQFENLVQNNRRGVFELLHIDPYSVYSKSLFSKTH